MEQVAEFNRKKKRRSRRSLLWSSLLVVLLFAIGGAGFRYLGAPNRPPPPPPPPVPVSVTAAARQDVPIILRALGTAQAWYTVAIHSQIDGPVQSVNFTEGQEARKGDILAVIDPRPFQAALDQANAKKAQDEAQLVAAQKDLVRAKTLGTRGFDTQQNIDQQQAKVDQLKATVQADEAAIESARIQLGYTEIKAPIDGRVGFRQVDPGNILHAADQTPITVLTQTSPIAIIFTLPQADLGRIREAMLRNTLPVEAYDQNDAGKLSDGELRLIDNQIDQTTSTIRLKAEFPNKDGRLWPGEFVRVRLEVGTKDGAVTVPPAAIQRGPQGLYVWTVKSDGTAEQRPVDTIPIDASTTIVTKGLAAGERVVVNGQSRLQPGSKVDARAAGAQSTASAGS
jgi:multidrug efflux system membrane fusion protein